MAPVLPPSCLPTAVPTILPSAEVAATRAVLSACATVIIDEVAKMTLHNHIFDFMVKLLIHSFGQYSFA